MLFGVIDIFAFLHASLLLKPWCTMIVQGDTTRRAVDSSEPPEAAKDRSRNEAHKM